MSRSHHRRRSASIVATLALLSTTLTPFAQAMAQDATTPGANDGATTTPIKHIIVIIGENRTFDHVFATFQPKAGQTVRNLLSEGIVLNDGTPGPNFSVAQQFHANVATTFDPAPAKKTSYAKLPSPNTDGSPSASSDTNPPPFASIEAVENLEAQIHDGLLPEQYRLLTTGASYEKNDTVDNRIQNVSNLPNGPFQLTGPKLAYDAYTASPVHRFYQMRQQLDCSLAHATSANPSGCLGDLFPWVEVTVGAGTNGKPQPANFTDETTGEGATSMGFYNMYQGDVPYFKYLAQHFAMSDNFHQSIHGGTGANHIALGTGLAIYYSDGQGHVATPPANQIENPNPQPGTNNWYTQDGYSGGSYSNCSDASQPGVGPVLDYLKSLPSKPDPKCAQGAYYLLNNYNPGYNGDGTVNTSAFTIPPSDVPTIGDDLNRHQISWRYYGAGWKNFVKDPNSELGFIYCNICNPFLYSSSIMTKPGQRLEHLKDVTNLMADIRGSTLPAVSIVKPDGLLDGHPASSKLNLFEAFSENIIEAVQKNKDLWKDTAILVTFDEGGGYWDSGYVQQLDFFGDGTRIPAILVSRFTQAGKISHVYADHVSFLKFVEKNWSLPPVSKVSRDNLPNPVVNSANAYVPINSPAIGDMMDMFDFSAAN
jgi:phospholipase C